MARRSGRAQEPVADTARLRQIYSKGIVGAPAGEAKLAHETVATIEGDLFARGWPSGDQLGTLPELQKRLGLGRWACREAVGIMQARGLVHVRRGPGGGLYVAEPTVAEAARLLLLFLSLSGARMRRIHEVQAITCAVIAELLVGRAAAGLLEAVPPVEGDGPMASLAGMTGNPGVRFLVELLQELCELCRDPAGEPAGAAGGDGRLASILSLARAGDRRGLAERLEGLSPPSGDPDALIVFPNATLDASSRHRHNYAAALAGKLLEKILTAAPGAPMQLGSETEIGERYGFKLEIVRQALRMLEDIGAVECHRGRRGGGLRARPTGGPVIRILYPCLVSYGLSDSDNFDIASRLALHAPRLAAERVRQGRNVAPPEPPVAAEDSAETPLMLFIAIENRLLGLAGNPILSILVRSFALQALFSETVSGRAFSEPLIDQITRCNTSIFRSIAAGDADGAEAAAILKDRLMRPPLEARRVNALNSNS